MISYRSSSVLARATVAWDLAGFDDHGGDPAEHVGGEGAESLHEVGVLCPRTEGEDFSQRCWLGEGTWESWCPTLHTQVLPTWTQSRRPPRLSETSPPSPSWCCSNIIVFAGQQGFLHLSRRPVGETKMPLPIMVPTINEIPLNSPDVDKMLSKKFKPEQANRSFQLQRSLRVTAMRNMLSKVFYDILIKYFNDI